MDNNNSCDNRVAHHSEELKKALKGRLNRIEGQIRGVNKMIEEDRYCDNILNQLSSIQSALTSVSTLLLEAHMKSCIKKSIENGDDAIIGELMATLKRMMK